jgi:hypothetical protein
VIHRECWRSSALPQKCDWFFDSDEAFNAEAAMAESRQLRLKKNTLVPYIL